MNRPQLPSLRAVRRGYPYAASLLTGVLALLSMAMTTVSAQTGGPLQPDFTTPSAAAPGPQVDPFTGSFSYGLPVMTVPGPNGSDYTITLAYHSGTSPDAGVPWVGYGWSLNPGAIVRNRQGFPDDWKDSVIYLNKSKPNWTVSGTKRIGFEISSKDMGIKGATVFTPAGGAGYSSVVRFNNSLGYSMGQGFDASVKGLGNLSLTQQEDGGSWSGQGSLSPGFLFSGWRLAGAPGFTNDADNATRRTNALWTGAAGGFMTSYLGTFGPKTERSYSFRSVPYTGSSTNYSFGMLINIPPWWQFGVEFGGKGNYTEQDPVIYQKVRGVGYMYSSELQAYDVADYHLDKDGAYRPGAMLLGIPFSNADEYSISGGAIGSFRSFNRRPGMFRPNATLSSLSIAQASGDITLGSRLGLGADIGAGASKYLISALPISNGDTAYQFAHPDSNGVFFRFNNDMGGNVTFADNDAAVSAEPNLDNMLPHVRNVIHTAVNDGGSVASLGCISYNTNAQLNKRTDKGRSVYAFDKDTSITSLVDRSEADLASQIGEFSVAGAGGMRYNYGLPVYSKAEKDLRYGVDRLARDSASRLDSRYVAYAYTDEESAPMVIGEKRFAPYATMHLLTSITTSDYKDLTYNGPTPDDLGGYTKFNYVRPAGSRNKGDSGWADNDWYFWRSPYNGMLYDANQLSTPDDDIGTVSSGRREEYYLQSIETKTHIAVFITNGTDFTYGKRFKGSGLIRMDGYTAGHNLEDRFSAKDVERTESGDSTYSLAATLIGGQRPNALRRLERIELYTKDTNGLPDSLLTTTFFDYDYSLRPGMPNSMRPHPDSSRLGVLTLRSVWSQQQRVYSQRISPYVFGYHYHPSTSYPAGIRSLYPQVTHFADSLTMADQNPPYRITDVDRWGNYQRNGAALYNKRIPWVNQNPDTNHFDPAAWQLKTVKSPTGAELQVQYEQNRYSYVQDRPAMGMVSLQHFVGMGSDSSFDSDNDNKYFINLADVGIADTDSLSVLKYRSLLRKEFTDSTSLQRAYFKFLYALIGDSAKLDNPEYESEYISGYGGIEDIDVAQVSSMPKRYGLYMTIRAPGGGGYAVPKQVCLDFVKKNRRGLLEGETTMPHSNSSFTMVMIAMGQALDAQFDPGKYCKHVDFEHSYIRLPLPRAKRGGGVRVKRLLTLDPGTERDTTLLGSEYIYETFDRDRGEDISSGVAVNEPSVGSEENALFNVPHFNGRPDLDTKIIAGADLEEYETPIGKSLLPGASVGYSRVVSKSIYNGRTQPGFSVQEFYTAKDYPFNRQFDTVSKSVDFTDIASKIIEPSSFDPLVNAVGGSLGPVGFGVHTDEHHQLSLQGYRFILNAMHGQPRRSSSYGGFYDTKSTWALSGLQEYNYFQPGEKIPLVGKISDSVRYGSVGKTMEVVSESKIATDYVNDFSIQADVTGSWVPPFAPTFSGAVQANITDHSLATHVTTKIIQYPAMVKSVLTYGDGMYHLAENVAFSSSTGQPLVTRSADGYDKLVLQKSPSGHKGGYFSYSIPATEYYPTLGAKSSNERVKLFNGNGLTITKDSSGGTDKLVVGYTDAGRLFGAMRQFIPGSLIYLRKSGTDVSRGLYHVDSVRDTVVYLLPVSPSQFAGLNTTQGTVDVEVLESGYANEPGASVGGFTTYGQSRSDVTAGTTITVSATTGFSTREALADRMTAIINGGGGLLSRSDLLGSSFLIGGSCHPMADSVWIVFSSNAITIQRFDTITKLLTCQVRLPYQSGHSRFAIDDNGALIYEGDAGLRFPLGSCFALCPNSSLYRVRSVSGVIAAGAQTLNDATPYDTAEYPSALSADGNRFELGMSGRWRPQMGYGYRTSVIRGSQHGSNERNYANAGVFNDFTLFNWNAPTHNDTTTWLKGDSVTRYSSHGDVLEAKDPLGIYSTTKLGYGNTLPILVAGNATYNSVAFESFESGFAYPSKLSDTAAHSGRYCLYAPPDSNIDAVIHVRMTPQLAAKGLDIRFWMRAVDAFHIDSADANIKIKLRAPTVTLTIPMTQWRKLARTGHWTLYEIAARNLAFRVDTDDIQMTISRSGADTVNPIWFDDIRMGPSDASMQCFVFDAKTYRPLAVFDDDHFGLYSQYNAEGVPVRTIVETAEGFKTVAEAHGHVPLADRSTSYDMAARRGGGGADGGSGAVYDIGHHTLPYREDDDDEPGAAGTKVDLLNVDLSATRQRATVLGGKTPELPSVDSLTMPSLQASRELERLQALGRLKALWSRSAELETQAKGELSDEARKQLDAEAQLVRDEKAKIVQKLGIPEEELQRLYDEWASQKEGQSDGK